MKTAGDQMLWIVGTSVSIEAGGYATRLRARVDKELGIDTTNLSVGDQTSIMGCMRVLQHLDGFSTGDVVVWEYSLLDTILTDICFPADDTHAARRLAWGKLVERGVSVLVLMVPPREELRCSTECEEVISDEARLFKFPCVDVRSMFARMGLKDPVSHYRDDRHPRHDSPIVDALVETVFKFTAAQHGTGVVHPKIPPFGGRAQHWQWLDAAALSSYSQIGVAVRQFRNSFMAVEAVVLNVDVAMQVPPASRVVGLGIVSTHESGGVWCGHPGCAPASTRLPASLDHGFLLRATGLPCVRDAVKKVASAPAWAYQSGTWAAYGQELCTCPGEVAVFGLLYAEVADSGRVGTRP